jgi:DNA-binding CsgD family transcriptional regulator
MVELGELLLALYGAAREVPLEEFQDRALNLLKSAVSFDSAIWGTGIITSQGLDYHGVHLHNEPPEIVGEYKYVKHQDTTASEVRPHRATTKVFHAPTLFRDQAKSAIRDYTSRFGHQNFIISSEIEQESGYAYWMSLYRASADRQYTESEQRLAAFIAPHLREALRINRVLQMERLRGIPGSGAMAIVDARGAVYHAEPGFTAAVQEEWRPWHGSILPQQLWHALTTGVGCYVGKNIVVRRASLTDVMFLKARKRTAVDRLSPREQAVAGYIAQGMSHKEIARVLGTSPQTVRNQIQSIHDKLGIHNAAELIAQLNAAT